MIERIMYAFVSRQQQGRNLAVPADPVEQDFLLLVRQIVWGIGLVYIVVHAAGGITEEKTLEQLSSGGFIYWSVFKGLLVQLNVNRRSAEDSLDDFLAGLDGSPDLFCQ